MDDSVVPYEAAFGSHFVLRRFFFSVKQKSDFLELLPLALVLPRETTGNKSVLRACDSFCVSPACPFSTLSGLSSSTSFYSVPHLVTCLRGTCGQKGRRPYPNGSDINFTTP